MNQYQEFLAAIDANPLDHVLRCVFADWLDEHGDVEEAARQREYVGAYEYLLNYFVDTYGRDREETRLDEELDEFDADEDEDYEPQRRPNHAESLTIIERWRQYLAENRGICFGSDEALENMWDEEKCQKFYRSMEIVTGAAILPETRAQASFRCAC